MIGPDQDASFGLTPGDAPSKRPKQTTLDSDHPRIKFLAMATLLIVSISAGFLGGWLASNRQVPRTAIEKEQVILKTQGELISSIAKTVGESVVSVETTTRANASQDFFNFGPAEQVGAGTGIILTEDGLIVTNRHVVPEGTSSVRVVLSDGTEFEDVEVVGRTSSTDSLDVAFLKLRDTKGRKLVPANIGDSAKMQVGEPVVAIGNALGQFQNTVTSGIISGYGRHVQAQSSSGAEENLENLFQTDAAINQGNSGGPLVNLYGEVIGINTAIAGGNAQNIGFAIPINDVVGLINSVKQTGTLQRPYLGIMYIPLTSDLAEQYGLSVKRGAYIPPADVLGHEPLVSGGPAAQAGLKAGDIIIKIDGQPIDQTNSLSSLINKRSVGDTLTLTIVRDGKEQDVSVKLGAAPTS